MAVYTETVALDDKVSGPADKAAKQVEILTKAVASTENALVKASASGNIAGYQKLSANLAAYKSALSQLPPVQKKQAVASQEMGKGTAVSAAKIGAAVDKVKAGLQRFDVANMMAIGKETVQAAVGGMKAAITSLAQGDVKGAIAGVTDGIAGMAKMLDFVVPGLGQAASVLVQIAGGFVGILAGLAKSGVELAIESSNAKASMISMFDALGQGVTSGAEFDDMLTDMSARLGITKDAMVPLVREFTSMGITSKEAVGRMTEAALSAKALAGGAESGSEAFIKLSKKIQLASETGAKLKIPLKGLTALSEMGLTVGDVASRMAMKTEDLQKALEAGTVDAGKFGDAMQTALIEKGAGPLQRMGSSFANMKAMFQQSIGDMFEDMGPEVDAFMAQIKSLLSIFSGGSESGKAMKSGIEGAFKAILRTATVVVPYIKHFLLDLVILGLKAYIGLKPIIAWLKEMAANTTVIMVFKGILIGIAVVIGVIVVAVVAVIAVFAALWAVMVGIGLAFYAVIGAIVALGIAIADKLSGVISTAIQFGKDFIAGLVNGIMSGVTAVKDAVSNVAGAAKDTFKSALGIKSPSTVMAMQGANTTEGVAVGMEEALPEVHAASANVAKAAGGGMDGADGAAGKAAGEASASKSGGGMTVNATITFNGAVQGAQELTEQAVSLIFEKLALEAGLA